MSVVKFITATGAPANGHAISVYAHGTTTPVIASGTTDANGEISVALTTQTQYDFGATNSSGDQVGGTFYLQPGNFITTAVFTGSGITASNLPTPTVTSITVANATTPGGLSADVAANVTVTNVPIDGSVFALAYFFRASGTVIWTPYGNEQMPTPIAASVTMPQFVYGQLQNGYSYDFAVGYLGPNGYGPTTTIKTGFTANAVVVVTSNIPAPTVAPTFTSVTVASVSTPTSIAADVGANLTVTNVPQNGSTIGVAYFFRQNGTTPWVPYGEEPFSSQTPPASVVMPQFVYGQLQNGIAYDFAIAYYGAGGVGPLATIFTNLTAHAIVVTTPYLIGTTSPVPVIAAGATATAVPSANGLAAGVTLAFTVTNQPTDGSLQRLSIWFRVYNSSGVPGPWTFDTSIAAAGLPTPSASQAYSVTISDLTNGQQYDFGVTYENAQGSDSSTVGVVYTGFTATTIVITTPYLIGTTSPVPTVTSVTVTNGTSDNGIAAAVTLAFTLTNQPTDGSLRRITIWFRKTGDTNWTFYAAQGAAGLPNPTASASYTITLADLTTSNTYDFGVKYENAQGADSASVGVIYSGWSTSVTVIPPKAIPTLGSGNMVVDSNFDCVAFNSSGFGSSDPYWNFYLIDGVSFYIGQGGATNSAGPANYLGVRPGDSAKVCKAQSEVINVNAGQQYTVSAYIDASTCSGANSPYISIVSTNQATEYARASQAVGTRGTVSASWTCPSSGGPTQVTVMFNSNNTTINSSILVFGSPQFQAGTLGPYQPGPKVVGPTPTSAPPAGGSGGGAGRTTGTVGTNDHFTMSSGTQAVINIDGTAGKNQDWLPDGPTFGRVKQTELMGANSGLVGRLNDGTNIRTAQHLTDIVIDNGGRAKLNVSPVGGVGGNLPYANHDTALQKGTFKKNLVVNGNNCSGSGEIAPNSYGWTTAFGSASNIVSGGLYGPYGSVATMKLTSNPNGGFYQDVPCTPGQTYTFAAVVSPDTANLNPGIWIGSTDGSYTQWNGSPTAPVGSLGTFYTNSTSASYNTWVYQNGATLNAQVVLYGSFTVPMSMAGNASINKMRVILYNSNGSVGGNGYYAGVMVIEGNRLQDYIDHELNRDAVYLPRHTVGILPYLQHDPAVTNTFDQTSGSDGLYLKSGKLARRHIGGGSGQTNFLFNPTFARGTFGWSQYNTTTNGTYTTEPGYTGGRLYLTIPSGTQAGTDNIFQQTPANLGANFQYTLSGYVEAFSINSGGSIGVDVINLGTGSSGTTSFLIGAGDSRIGQGPIFFSITFTLGNTTTPLIRCRTFSGNASPTVATSAYFYKLKWEYGSVATPYDDSVSNHVVTQTHDYNGNLDHSRSQPGKLLPYANHQTTIQNRGGGMHVSCAGQMPYIDASNVLHIPSGLIFFRPNGDYCRVGAGTTVNVGTGNWWAIYFSWVSSGTVSTIYAIAYGDANYHNIFDQSNGGNYEIVGYVNADNGLQFHASWVNAGHLSALQGTFSRDPGGAKAVANNSTLFNSITPAMLPFTTDFQMSAWGSSTAPNHIFVSLYSKTGGAGTDVTFYQPDGTTFLGTHLGTSVNNPASMYDTGVVANGDTFYFLIYWKKNDTTGASGTGWHISIKDNVQFTAAEIAAAYADGGYVATIARLSTDSVVVNAGSGGTVGGCPEIDQEIEVKRFDTGITEYAAAKTLRAGDLLRDPDGTWNVIYRVGIDDAQIWEVEFDTETIRVDASHLFDTTLTGNWVNVQTLRPNDVLPRFNGGTIIVQRCEPIRMGKFVHISCDRMRYVLGKTVSHNAKPL